MQPLSELLNPTAFARQCHGTLGDYRFYRLPSGQHLDQGMGQGSALRKAQPDLWQVGLRFGKAAAATLPELLGLVAKKGSHVRLYLLKINRIAAFC